MKPPDDVTGMTFSSKSAVRRGGGLPSDARSSSMRFSHVGVAPANDLVDEGSVGIEVGEVARAAQEQRISACLSGHTRSRWTRSRARRRRC
ncbi:MAG: hypothetical protein KJZ80_13045 [Hyphomicrobiaceae bacterium]|nr:hypothetical protein [Hyphomicrobiaceae bacterium]